MQTQNTPIYLKAITLRDMNDIPSIKDDAKKHMILILRVTPLAQKDVAELRCAIEDLYKYVQSVGGEIGRRTCSYNSSKRQNLAWSLRYQVIVGRISCVR